MWRFVERRYPTARKSPRFLNRLVHEVFFHEIQVTVTPVSPSPLVRGPNNPTVITTMAILHAINAKTPKGPNRRKSNAMPKLETTIDRRLKEYTKPTPRARSDVGYISAW